METIYRWFAALFGGDMADYLSGYVCPSQETEGGYIGNNQFVMYGFIALGIALAVMLIYYYVINHPRFIKWWHWLLMLVLVGLSNLFIGAINIGDCLINGSNGGISDSNCWMFGLANFFVSAIFFIIFSISFKWWSSAGKRTPF